MLWLLFVFFVSITSKKVPPGGKIVGRGRQLNTAAVNLLSLNELGEHAGRGNPGLHLVGVPEKLSMNCDDCSKELSLYLDNELDEIQAVAVRAHVAICSGCAKLLEDLSSIMFTCAADDSTELVPPNSHALWCRISNTIESEIKPPIPQVEAPQRRFWSLSLPQLGSAILCVAIVSSLLTVITVRNYLMPPADQFTSRAIASQTTFEKILGKVGLVETPEKARERHIREQMAAISYWNNRVQMRRSEWDARTRDAFDRNLQVIDESLEQYNFILQQDPEDELSVEMLDSVMNDKMNLLRDFSDL